MADAVKGIEITEQTPVHIGTHECVFDTELRALNVGYAGCPGDIYIGARMPIGAILHTEHKVFLIIDRARVLVISLLLIHRSSFVTGFCARAHF
jgi:hypothetical protein